MVSIAGGEPLMHPQIDEIVGGADRAQEVRLPVHERAAAARRSSTCSQPSPYFSWVVHIDGLQERHDESVERRACSTRRLPRSREAKRARLQGQHEHHVLHHRHAEDRARRARLPERRARGRPDDDLAGLRLREGTRPGPLPRRRPDPGAVQRGVRRRPPQAAGGSTTHRSSSTSSRARSTSSARRGGSRATRSSAGSGRAT